MMKKYIYTKHGWELSPAEVVAYRKILKLLKRDVNTAGADGKLVNAYRAYFEAFNGQGVRQDTI